MRAVAIAGYRVMENLIHGQFLYVDDLVTATGDRGQGLGGTASERAIRDRHSARLPPLVLDTAAANVNSESLLHGEKGWSTLS